MEFDESRMARDLVSDPGIRWIDRHFPVFVLITFGLPVVLGWALSGSLRGGLTGLVWGGFVRIALTHHIAFSVNSLCHFFGSRPFAVGDRSGNVSWLALLTLGESWHHNHHAFPRSAAHGLDWWQLDPSAWLIYGLERLGLAWELVEVTAEQREARAAPG